MNSFNFKYLDEVPIVGILRGFQPRYLEGILGACVEGGLRNVEITIDSPEAERQIARAVRFVENQLNVGAGTVTTMERLERALRSGAQFVVMPVFDSEIVRACVQREVPVFPAAATPTEIYRAWNAGAAMIKVFPGETLGPSFIKAVKAPLPQVKLMPTGGVNLDTLAAYRQAGADAYGIGGPLFDKGRVEKEDWNWLAERCRQFVRAVR